MWAFLFLILKQCGKNGIPFTLVNFGISQFVSVSPKENFLVYALMQEILIIHYPIFYLLQMYI